MSLTKSIKANIETHRQKGLCVHEYIPEYAMRVSALFENGASVEEICLRLGINQKTFAIWRRKYPDFNYATEMGELSAESFFEDLFQEAIAHDLDDVFVEIVELMQRRFPGSYL